MYPLTKINHPVYGEGIILLPQPETGMTYVQFGDQIQMCPTASLQVMQAKEPNTRKIYADRDYRWIVVLSDDFTRRTGVIEKATFVEMEHYLMEVKTYMTSTRTKKHPNVLLGEQCVMVLHSGKFCGVAIAQEEK